MSAISGIFYRDGRDVDPDKIKKMNKTLVPQRERWIRGLVRWFSCIRPSNAPHN